MRREIISEHPCDYILTESLKDRYSSKNLIHCLNSKIKIESEPLGPCLNFPLTTRNHLTSSDIILRIYKRL